MKRFILAPLAAWFALLAAGSPASAQYSGPMGPNQGGVRYPGWQTPLSPYLNMLRPGDPGINYFALVQPEFQRRQDRNAIYGSLQGMANQLPERPGIAEDELNAPLRSTGHPTAFGYTGGYFGAGTGAGSPTANKPSNAFPQRQAGPKSKWPRSNKAQPAGQKPKTP